MPPQPDMAMPSMTSNMLSQPGAEVVVTTMANIPDITPDLSTKPTTVINMQGEAMALTPSPTLMTPISPSQSKEINAILDSYVSSLKHAPGFTELGLQLMGDRVFDVDDFTQLVPFATATMDLASFAAAPPLITAEPTWYQEEAQDVKDNVASFQGSAFEVAQGIVRTQLNLIVTSVPFQSWVPGDGNGMGEGPMLLASGAKGVFVGVGKGLEILLVGVAGAVSLLAFVL